MTTDISPQQVRQNLLRSIRVASCDVESLLAFGEQLNHCFLLEEGKGMLEKPIKMDDWFYQEFDPDSNTLHHKAQAILDVVLKEGFPIMQIIYGYQEANPEVKPLKKPRIQVPDRTVKTVTSLAKAAFVIAGGVTMVVGYTFLAALSAIDPKLIVVLNTGEDEKELPWICLMSWVDEPENL